MGSTRARGLGLALSFTLASTPQAAEACGGFFCAAAQPVNQAAERIVFAVNGDGTVTAIVQIVYQGPSDRFSWVLPVPGVPTVGVSSNVVFDNLQTATNPRYIMRTQIEGTCASTGGFDAGLGGVQDASFGASDSGGGGGGVTVLASGSVGPYNYDVIMPDPNAADPAGVAVAWLGNNGYDVTNVGGDLLGPYLAASMNLIAFRLTKESMAGEIRPVSLTYTTNRPMIPIKLTAVAASNEMPVLVWVLGSDRAVPINYRSLVLNEALINWFSPGATYNQIVNRAAMEAGGQGFVTEMSGSTAGFGEVVYPTWRQQRWASFFRGGGWVSSGLPGGGGDGGFGILDSGQGGSGSDGGSGLDAGAGGRALLLLQAALSYGQWDGFVEVVNDFVPRPSGVSLSSFTRCFNCYYGPTDVIPGFDEDAFLDAIEANVLQPLTDARAHVESRPHISRLYTTMSAPQMTLDPEFDFNASLPDLSNVHTATRTIECAPTVTRFQAPWRVELPQGDTVRGQGRSWPLPSNAAQPANDRVEQLGMTGAPTTITNNRSAIEAALAAHNATVPAPPQPDPDAGAAEAGTALDSGIDGGGGEADADPLADADPPVATDTGSLADADPPMATDTGSLTDADSPAHSDAGPGDSGARPIIDAEADCSCTSTRADGRGSPMIFALLFGLGLAVRRPGYRSE